MYLQVDLPEWKSKRWVDNVSEFFRLVEETAPKNISGWEPICKPKPFMELDEFEVTRFAETRLFEIDVPFGVINDNNALNACVYFEDVLGWGKDPVLHVYAGDKEIVRVVLGLDYVERMYYKEGCVLIQLRKVCRHKLFKPYVVDYFKDED